MILPARKLDFNDPLTASIFKEVHNLGNWVVNYDELLDRRQLLNQNVKIIRYKQGAIQGWEFTRRAGSFFYPGTFCLIGLNLCGEGIHDFDEANQTVHSISLRLGILC